jgi:hypothetical protein
LEGRAVSRGIVGGRESKAERVVLKGRSAVVRGEPMESREIWDVLTRPLRKRERRLGPVIRGVSVRGRTTEVRTEVTSEMRAEMRAEVRTEEGEDSVESNRLPKTYCSA